jgi:hypothetical protein
MTLNICQYKNKAALAFNMIKLFAAITFNMERLPKWSALA